MKTRPIKMHEFMNEVIINGLKTQTRRPLRIQPDGVNDFAMPYLKGKGSLVCKYGSPGDLLWVRNPGSKKDPQIWMQIQDIRCEKLHEISIMDCILEGIKSKPEIGWLNYMKGQLPDVEMAEWLDDPVASFASLWEISYGLRSWEKNKWVWIIEFKFLCQGRDPIESDLEIHFLDGLY